MKKEALMLTEEKAKLARWCVAGVVILEGLNIIFSGPDGLILTGIVTALIAVVAGLVGIKVGQVMSDA
jgi:hypothetical protein